MNKKIGVTDILLPVFSATIYTAIWIFLSSNGALSNSALLIFFSTIFLESVIRNVGEPAHASYVKEFAKIFAIASLLAIVCFVSSILTYSEASFVFVSYMIFRASFLLVA